MEVKTIPVVIGALGLINRGLESFLKKLPVYISIQELPKIALGTAHIYYIRKTLMIK
jgi:hypothetical protein